MEDGPMSAMSIPERRERLRVYSDAWKHLRWSACIRLPNVDKYAYAMDIAPGGILIFVSKIQFMGLRENSIIFVQIPSNFRGIPMRQWKHSFPFIPRPGQYALDPSEDILVVFQRRHQSVALHPTIPVTHSFLSEYRFHFLSLTTGDPHPLAATSLLSKSRHLMRSADLKNFQLRVAQNYLAILNPMHELCVCDWKTGQIVLVRLLPSLNARERLY